MNIFKKNFAYTTCTEGEAIEEILGQLKHYDLKVIDAEVISSERACRNAYGKEMDEEDFDDIDVDSDECWFDDYDFIVQVCFETDMNEEDFDNFLFENISEFLEDE